MNHKLGKKDEGKSETGCSDWSRIPVEILDIIVEKLEHFRDRLSLASVCKDWRIPVTSRPLPWVAAFPGKGVFVGNSRSVTISFEFHEICSNVSEPCHLRPYKRSLKMATCVDPSLVEPKPQASECGRFIRRILPPDTPFSDDDFIVQPRIEESKLGWLVILMYNRFIGNDNHTVRGSFFVYHPFSARSMILPDLQNQHYTITFSGSDPTSSDCVFFAIGCQGKNLSIHTWSPGQEAWKERHVIMEDHDWFPLSSVTWLDGIFYWCNYIHMESFNPSNGERKEIALPSQLAGMNRCIKLYEVNGEILIFVYHIKHTKRIELFFKFNPLEGTWIRRDDCLNDQVLFTSKMCPSCYSVSGYVITSSSRVFRNYDLSNDCQDDVDMKKKTVVERLMIDCLANINAVTKPYDVEWLAPPLKTFG